MTGGRILNVEDNPVLRRMLRQFLEAKGFTVIEATDGKEAIERARGERPDLILMDVQLPVLSGLDATRAIKSTRELERIPVLALTGFALEGDEERCRDAGCDDYMTKPYDMDDLLTRIQSLIG